MNLEAENFILRSWKKTDLPELVKLANNKQIFDNLRDLFPYPYTTRDARLWLDFVEQNDNPPRFFAIETGGLFAGSIGFELKSDIYRKNAEIGYWLGQPYWNRNIMTEAIILITNYIFLNLDIVRVYAEPFADNTASRRALEKAGFRCEAVFRDYVVKNNIVKDSCIYAVLKKDWFPPV